MHLNHRRAVAALGGAAALALSSCSVTGPSNSGFALATEPADHPSPGPYERPTTCASDEARSWFQRGLMWTYGFHHDEAIRCFERAQEIEPDYAMAHWGEAHARGPNINDSVMAPERALAAHAAAQRALELAGDVMPVERALIEAQAARYTSDALEDRAHLEAAYAERMRAAWEAFPNDADVGTLYAESLLDLHPWDQWSTNPETRERTPLHETVEVVRVLETVLAAHPNHPGANHLYIHTMENSPWPERALPSAQRLADLAPNSGHLVHMPAHIFHRVGMYTESLEANQRAVEVDRAYFASTGPQGLYRFYYIHNQHFEAWSAMATGREADARAAAQAIIDDAPPHIAGDAGFDAFQAVTIHVAIRFGRWDEVLAAPERGDAYPIYRALRHYARGIAFAATGRVDEARAEQAKFDVAQRFVVDGMVIGVNPAPPVMGIAEAMLEGEILYREGKFDEAFAELRRAARLEDELRYDEPSPWMQPVRHALGALLLEQDRAADAEAVFRDDLVRNPENGWALHGLARALEAQGKRAGEVRKRYRTAWANADTELEVECFCATAPTRVASR